MNKALRIPDYLTHISEAIEKIAAYVGEKDWPGFNADAMLQDATMRNLENIGEAARNIMRADPKFADKYPWFPAVRAVGMRNSLAHGYFDVKLEMVWDTVKKDLPSLYPQLKELQSRLNEASD